MRQRLPIPPSFYITITPDNPDAELAGFSELIDNPELLERLGNAAAEDAKNLTWDARAMAILEFVKGKL